MGTKLYRGTTLQPLSGMSIPVTHTPTAFPQHTAHLSSSFSRQYDAGRYASDQSRILDRAHERIRSSSRPAAIRIPVEHVTSRGSARAVSVGPRRQGDDVADARYRSRGSSPDCVLSRPQAVNSRAPLANGYNKRLSSISRTLPTPDTPGHRRDSLGSATAQTSLGGSKYRQDFITSQPAADSTVYGRDGLTFRTSQPSSDISSYSSSTGGSRYNSSSGYSTGAGGSYSSRPSVGAQSGSSCATNSSGAGQGSRRGNTEQQTCRTTPGLVGLKNLGNTCFMNSVLQCLSHTSALRRFCCDDVSRHLNTASSMQGRLLKAFAALLQQLWFGDSHAVAPDDFKAQLQRFAPRFVGYSQQDSQEFLRYLLEGLHEDANRVRQKPKLPPYNEAEDEQLKPQELAGKYWGRYKALGDSCILDLFVGQLCSTLTCTKCQNESICFDPFWDLSLSIPKGGSPTLTRCIELFMQTETLDGDEKPACSKCRSRQRSTKCFRLQRLPRVLVVHLKRFSGERFRSKLSSTVQFEHSLDLAPYLSPCTSDSSAQYELYAVSNHSGSCYSGHYTAYAKHPDTGRWHCFDDSSVREISSDRVVTSEAYVLFYVKKEFAS